MKFKSAITKSLENFNIKDILDLGNSKPESEGISLIDDDNASISTQKYFSNFNKSNKNLKLPYIIGTPEFFKSEFLVGSPFENGNQDINNKQERRDTNMSIIRSDNNNKSQNIEYDLSAGNNFYNTNTNNFDNGNKDNNTIYNVTSIPTIPTVPIIPKVPSLPEKNDASQNINKNEYKDNKIPYQDNESIISRKDDEFKDNLNRILTSGPKTIKNSSARASVIAEEEKTFIEKDNISNNNSNLESNSKPKEIRLSNFIKTSNNLNDEEDNEEEAGLFKKTDYFKQRSVTKSSLFEGINNSKLRVEDEEESRNIRKHTVTDNRPGSLNFNSNISDQKNKNLESKLTNKYFRG